MPLIVRSFRFKLLPTRQQHEALERIAESQRLLYNAALQERIDAWAKARVFRTYMDQCRALTECRRELPDMAALPLNIQRATLKRLDEAFAGFRRRLKAGGRAGFPRFKGKGWWSSFGFAQFMGIRWDRRRLRWAGLPGGLRVHLTRPLPAGRILSCTIKRSGAAWHVAFQVEHEVTALRPAGRTVGLDLGLSSLITLSDGTKIENLRANKRARAEMRRRQRALARCKRSSKGRRKARARLARLHQRITNQRETYLHTISARLIRDYDLISVEDLRVAALARGSLSGSVADASWGKLLQFLAYKAESAGRTITKVDPRNTSQACSHCGTLVKKALRDRVHACPSCGTVLDRDHNAALNILHRAVVGPGLAKLPAAAA